MSARCGARQRSCAALDIIGRLTEELGDTPPGDGNRFDMRRIEWFDLRNMLLVARVVAEAALARTETRGAQQREDYPQLSPDWAFNQIARLRGRAHRIVGRPTRRRGGGVMSESATLKIWRGLDANAGRWESYEVPFEPGQSVLDGLRWIRANRDPTLAIRFSCINANACKECMIELDGKTVYACTARLQPREMTLAPLSNKTARARSGHRNRAAGGAFHPLKATLVSAIRVCVRLKGPKLATATSIVKQTF